MKLLTAIVFLPAAAGLILALVSRALSPRAVKVLGIAAALATFVLSLVLLTWFVPGEGYQFVERVEWLKLPVPPLTICYCLGIDGISLAMVLLTTFLTPLALLTAWSGSTASEKFLTVLMLFLETAVLGVFCALDLFLFYMFWEASLIPMYFIIGVWGGPRRIYSCVKFFLFTMGGGVVMLAAVLFLALKSASFSIPELAAAPLSLASQRWLFWAFFVAFAVKVPLVPLHTWLPDAHVEAPTAGSVILAGVLLKLGGYGIVRFCLGLFPAVAGEFRFALVIIGVAAIIYGAVMVMVQRDLKRLVAYSSVSHMGYVVAGIGSLTAAGISGGVIQMVSHGFISGALFAVVGILYERTHTRDLDAYGGVSHVLPHFSWAFLLITLASIGLPGTSGFVGEFMCLLGLAGYSIWFAALGALGVILGAVYMLSMFRRVMHGPVTRPEIAGLKPLCLREAVVLACFIVAIVAVGVYPGALMRMLAPSVTALARAAGVEAG